jgi:hypothetical protein
MIRWYKNSFLASVVSIIGCAAILVGIYSIVDETIVEGVIAIVVGLALAIWGKQISENKAFKTWWKQVTDANLEPQIAQSVDVAIQVYNKNPQKRTLKKIAELNPAAAESIERQLAAKK